MSINYAEKQLSYDDLVGIMSMFSPALREQLLKEAQDFLVDAESDNRVTELALCHMCLGAIRKSTDELSEIEKKPKVDGDVELESGL